MSTALTEFEKMTKTDLTNRLAQLDTIEEMIEKATDAQHEADEKFRDYMLREVPAPEAKKAQAKADREADKVERAWNGFVRSLSYVAQQEFPLADDTTSFTNLHKELCIAHKDLNRALSAIREAA